MGRNIFWYSLSCLIISLQLFFTGCENTPHENKPVKFVILLKSTLNNQKVYLTGNNKELGNWKPDAVAMEKESDSVWVKTLYFKKGERIDFKITKGSWTKEAVNENGWLYDDFHLQVWNDTVIKIIIPNWKDNIYERRIIPSLFTGTDPVALLINNWKYHSGDNPDWAKGNFNDSSWQTVTSDLLTKNLSQA